MSPEASAEGRPQAPPEDIDRALRAELGPLTRALARRYFEPVRFPEDADALLRQLHQRGRVVHVMRTSAWLNYLYLAWALVRRGLPPVRAAVNLRPWPFKPWRRTAQRGSIQLRLAYARRHRGSGLVFLKRAALGSARGRSPKLDPFPELVALARAGDEPVYLVPELLAWEASSSRLKPTLTDFVFGGHDAPGLLHTLLGFWRNHPRAQLRLGEPVDLAQYVQQHPDDSDERLARKVRGALHHHLAREARAVFGPPFKHTHRIIGETLRDRDLRRELEALAARAGRRPEAVFREAKKHLNAIAARPDPTVIALAAPLATLLFRRLYDGIEVDEAGLERALKAASRAPLVFCPSHKSHVDYVVMHWLLWSRGYAVPRVAAGANLAFFPLGTFFRRVGGYFLRRSFKDDRIYAATFKAYVRKLVREGAPQEFFLEGGRSRTGKLLAPKLGLLGWQVEAVLDGARDDLMFVPVSIDYEKVIESRSYSQELAGAEKKPEDLKALLQAPKVLASRYGRIHLNFDEPISVRELAASRGLALDSVDGEQRKSLVRALGHRILYGISRVSTVTPQALVAAALLAHRHRGATSEELSERIGLLRQLAEEQSARLSPALRGAPSDPTVMGAVQDAVRGFAGDGLVHLEEAKGQAIFLAVEEQRPQLSFYKNTLMNLVAPRSVVATALLASGEAPLAVVRESALFLSRLFKLEFIYRVGAPFEALFEENVERLERAGLAIRRQETLGVAPEPHSRPQLEFFSDLLRDFLESYYLAALALEDLSANGPTERRAFVKAALETGRSQLLTGGIQTAEALSRTTLENAVAYFVEQRILVEQDNRVALGPNAADAPARQGLLADVRRFLRA